MKIKISLLLYALSLWVVSPVLAQNNGNGNGGGNGSGKGHGHGRGHSDKGGPNDNGSDKGGPDDNGSDKGDHHGNSSRLMATTAQVVTALAGGTLTTSSGVSIPVSAQAKVYAVLTRSAATTGPVPQRSAGLAAAGPEAGAKVLERLEVSFAQLSAPLAAAGPSAEAVLPPLIRSLSGLAYNPDWLPTVIGNYNNFVQSASASFLANPPPEFLALHAVLAKLTAAAGGSKLTAAAGGK